MGDTCIKMKRKFSRIIIKAILIVVLLYCGYIIYDHIGSIPPDIELIRQEAKAYYEGFKNESNIYAGRVYFYDDKAFVFIKGSISFGYVEFRKTFFGNYKELGINVGGRVSHNKEGAEGIDWSGGGSKTTDMWNNPKEYHIIHGIIIDENIRRIDFFYGNNPPESYFVGDDEDYFLIYHAGEQRNYSEIKMYDAKGNLLYESS